VNPTDYLKISHPLGWGVSNLILSMVEFKGAYDAAGTWAQAVRNMKWATDWLIKAHVKASDNPRDNVFVGQVCVLHSRNSKPAAADDAGSSW
jgi:hypothetical protein